MIISSESSIAISLPVGVEVGESSLFSIMHSGILYVIFNNGVIVINVSFKDAFSGNSIISLGGEGGKFLFPCSLSALFEGSLFIFHLLYVVSQLGEEVKDLLDGISGLVLGGDLNEALNDGSIGIEFFKMAQGFKFSSDFFNFRFKLNPTSSGHKVTNNFECFCKGI